jgi:hypothetical protein
MSMCSWLRHSMRIARTERTRSQRQLGRSSALRAIIAIVLVCLSVSSGIVAYTFGSALSRGQATLPLDAMQGAAAVEFLLLLIGFVQRTSRLIERLDTTHLLTTVSVREVVLGVVLAVSGREAIQLSLPAISVAIGFAVGTRSPRRVAEWVLLRTRRDPHRLMYLVIPVITIGGSLMGGYSDSLAALAAPLCAVVLPWLAGSLFALNPLGDEGAVLPVTLTTVSGTQYVRGLMVPGLFLGLPIVIVVTTLAGIVSPYTLAEQYSLVGLGVYLTCVSVAITPAIGMSLPRFSAISIGQSQEALPPRMSAAILHLALIMIPGALLTMLVIVPRIARGVLAILFGSLPAFLIGLLTHSAGGPLSAAAVWFDHVGKVIRAVEVGQLQIVAGGMLLSSGIIVVILLYQHAVRQFERYSPA